MSQEALARILDVSKTAVSSWERTESARVYLKRLPQLADALGMTLEQLRREIGAETKRGAAQRLIRVPSSVYDALAARAKREGKSVPAFLAGLVNADIKYDVEQVPAIQLPEQPEDAPAKRGKPRGRLP